ncbi:LacI family transcriptional regulator [Amycolatopsis rubida]|uniref:LacI family transcriptional regulator n=1 Tax=Amycolatopsis rubida TaxID=112413 RepID=A0ABX0BUU4_9PSEU|nr:MULTISPECIES: LacI family DNA-binding transcriptional regulator [Amycolatopsis]MYW92985.1 substrate-binding domain-containing protein [Amycolatopsis rubida]NEC57972.1 LacI family transcriptional regulator [Amycolatopsis rubida]OAP25510.1 HTH-type transcriptional repressor CytR [Amycolatopsis sp. M39]
MNTRRPSIHDVAAAANVSITTVSHALSGKGRLPQETRDHVRQAAERLGYTPSFTARGLATGRSTLLAIQASGFGPETLVPDLAYITDILNAASSHALERGYALVVLPPQAPVAHIERLGFEGATVIDPLGQETLLGAMRGQGKPVVTMGRIVTGSSSIPFVDTDHDAATTMVLDHLWDQGYRRPAVLTGGRGLSYVESVTRTYRGWCAERTIPDRIVEVDGRLTDESGRQAMSAALRTRRGEIDSVYATLDALAIGAMTAARDLGISVPDQLGIASITDSPLLRIPNPMITALDLHPAVIGVKALSMLIDTIEGGSAGGKKQGELIPADLVVRDSTARAASG